MEASELARLQARLADAGAFGGLEDVYPLYRVPGTSAPDDLWDVIDIGAEGGQAGGYLVAAGTPEEIAQVDESHTGQFLRGVLG